MAITRCAALWKTVLTEGTVYDNHDLVGKNLCVDGMCTTRLNDTTTATNIYTYLFLHVLSKQDTVRAGWLLVQV